MVEPAANPGLRLTAQTVKCLAMGLSVCSSNRRASPVGLACSALSPENTTSWLALTALRHQAWSAVSQSRGPVSLPRDAVVQQQPQPVLAKLRKSCWRRLIFLMSSFTGWT
jgi:hypothetical protein